MTVSKKATTRETRFDGDQLRAMVSLATRLFERNMDIINALNVFPVPDGDTGTNMYLTLRDVAREAETIKSTSAGEIGSAMARAALMGARGNSGLILSQFFKGMALGLQGKADFGASELAAAFQRAREHAYKAVGNPVEGTLLTVIGRAAEACRETADAGGTVGDLLDAACDAARDGVALTPTMLPVLREAGVVDAGGHGFLVLLEGMRLYVHGRTDELREIAPPEPIGVEVGEGVVSREFLDATEEELYGYCTQFLIQGRDLDPDAVKDSMASLAQSTVVVGSDTMLKVHVHALDSGPIISLARSLGTLNQVTIDDMDEQHNSFSIERRQVATSVPAEAGTAPTTVVAVAKGQGLEAVLADLGAAKVMSFDGSATPSIQEILDVVEGAPSDDVIFLPNSHNLVDGAKQAAEISGKRLRVVSTSTIPQGIAAMLAFNPERDLDENVSDMERAVPSVRTGEVCLAERAAQMGGVSVKEGQVIGLLERKLVVGGDEPSRVLVSLLEHADVAAGDLVTIYWGGPLTHENADNAREQVEAAFPQMEVDVVPGGQLNYHFIVSIE